MIIFFKSDIVASQRSSATVATEKKRLNKQRGIIGLLNKHYDFKKENVKDAELSNFKT